MYIDGSRRMAWVSKIKSIQDHGNADALEICVIGGWNCITKKGEYQVGDIVIYVSIDSWVPTDIAPFLSKGREPREYLGVKGERLRTVRLRGELSQGLILPLSVLPSDTVVSDDLDVSEVLNIQKFESSIPACLSGRVRGSFPSFGIKTDQERIQNIHNRLFGDNGEAIGLQFDAEEKLDGSSCSVIAYDGVVHVCSRNIDIDLSDESNSFVRTVKQTGLIEALENLGRNIQVSGELCGEGIQKNRYNISGHKLFVYDVINLDTREKMSRSDRDDFIKSLDVRIESVPLVVSGVVLDQSFDTVGDMIKFADGKSILNPSANREGFVFKGSTDGNLSFKVISNKFLLKGGDD